MRSIFKFRFRYWLLVILSVFALVAVSGESAVSQSFTPEQAAIAEVVETSMSEPGYPPTVVDAVIVEGDYAMASWISGEFGGVDILKRNPDGSWESLNCGTGGVYNNDELVEACSVPRSTADAIWQSWMALDN